MENVSNPLKGYFRKPGIWIKLPSQGQYYAAKPKELNDMGEIPVYPMTARDELMLKNADALLNGTAVSQLLQSCVPCIENPESMPAIDLDPILLAIRRCTYGEKMDITTVCDCDEKAVNEVTLNLNHFISSITVLDRIDPIGLDNGIKIYVKPVSIKQLLHLNWVQYEQVRNIQLAEQQNVDEKTRVDLLQKSYNELTTENINIVADCVDTVLLPDGVTVTDRRNIKEWMSDLSKPDFKLIETAIMAIGEKGLNKKFSVDCAKCKKTYESQLDLNPTTFFE